MIIRAPPKRNNALKGESTGRCDSGSAEVEVVWQGPVELEVGDGVRIGGVKSRRLIEEPGEDVALRWSAGRREGRGHLRDEGAEPELPHLELDRRARTSGMDEPRLRR